MPTDATDTPPFDASAATDSGMRCPQCRYNLTGLTESRCPECGNAFDWDAVRQAAMYPARIAFERARGWRKVPAFVVTWVTVLFAPWVFARQIVQQVSWRHAFVFGAICFGGTALAYFNDLDNDFHAAWLCTALIYILLQTLWLAMLDPAVWQHAAQTLRFWFLVGCYTSAVMMTEIVMGPPPLFVSDLWDFVTTGHVDSWFDDVFEPGFDSAVWWGQLCLWLVALCCVYARRVSRHPASGRVVAWTVFVGVSLLVLYAVTLERIGGPVSSVFD